MMSSTNMFEESPAIELDLVQHMDASLQQLVDKCAPILEDLDIPMDTILDVLYPIAWELGNPSSAVQSAYSTPQQIYQGHEVVAFPQTFQSEEDYYPNTLTNEQQVPGATQYQEGTYQAPQKGSQHPQTELQQEEYQLAAECQPQDFRTFGTKQEFGSPLDCEDVYPNEQKPEKVRLSQRKHTCAAHECFQFVPQPKNVLEMNHKRLAEWAARSNVCHTQLLSIKNARRKHQQKNSAKKRRQKNKEKVEQMEQEVRRLQRMVSFCP
eukprot:m.16216 g.16216  ORF g.16216 m.16216 type:complete len:266 (+) comp5622_c0_seq1:282-1079(+)